MTARTRNGATAVAPEIHPGNPTLRRRAAQFRFRHFAGARRRDGTLAARRK
jgi:hypothetical protein